MEGIWSGPSMLREGIVPPWTRRVTTRRVVAKNTGNPTHRPVTVALAPLAYRFHTASDGSLRWTPSILATWEEPGNDMIPICGFTQ
jgi:hypothetical protein